MAEEAKNLEKRSALSQLKFLNTHDGQDLRGDLGILGRLYDDYGLHLFLNNGDSPDPIESKFNELLDYVKNLPQGTLKERTNKYNMLKEIVFFRGDFSRHFNFEFLGFPTDNNPIDLLIDLTRGSKKDEIDLHHTLCGVLFNEYRNTRDVSWIGDALKKLPISFTAEYLNKMKSTLLTIAERYFTTDYMDYMDDTVCSIAMNLIELEEKFDDPDYRQACSILKHVKSYWRDDCVEKLLELAGKKLFYVQHKEIRSLLEHIVREEGVSIKSKKEIQYLFGRQPKVPYPDNLTF